MPKKLAKIVLRQKSVRSVWKLECKSREIAFFILRQLGREYDMNFIMNIKVPLYNNDLLLHPKRDRHLLLLYMK